MAFRLLPISLAAAALLSPTILRAQVFVVGEKTAMADVTTDFHPTRVQLANKPINELGRRTLVRDLEAEQGFAHRALPLASEISLMANGNLTPAGDSYKELIYKKGQSASPGDRVVISTVTFKPDRIIFDVNGGPYLKHRFLRHIDLNDTPLVPNDGAQVTGFRLALIFEGGVPDISAPEVKALLDPVIDFGMKSSGQAYADTLPPFLKQAIEQHDVLVGMNRRMVLAAMGAPDSKVRESVSDTDSRHYEEWIYGKVPQTVRFVRIEGDRVTRVKVAALGQPIAVRTENELQGFLDPMDAHEIALGDHVGSNDEDARPAGPPPTLRKPGDPIPPGGSQRVQFPDQTAGPHKEQPLPAAPGSPADTSSAGEPIGQPPSIAHSGRTQVPGSIPNIGSNDPQASDPQAGPATRVN